MESRRGFQTQRGGSREKSENRAVEQELRPKNRRNCSLEEALLVLEPNGKKFIQEAANVYSEC